MKTKLDDYNLSFRLGGYDFKVLNLVFERFERQIPLHSHSDDSFELHIIPYGYGQAVIDGKAFDITPGTVFMTGPFVMHSQKPDKDDPMCEYCIYFRVTKSGGSSDNEEKTIAENFVNTPFTLMSDGFGASQTVKELFDELTVRNIGFEKVAESLLKQLVVKLVRMYPVSGQKSETVSGTNTLENTLLIIEEAFLYEYDSITLQKLSNKLGLSIRQTERLIKEHYRKTFAEWKTEARMSAAAMMLTATSKSVTEIAMDVGYSTIEHFSTAFKKYHLISPREYRNRAN